MRVALCADADASAAAAAGRVAALIEQAAAARGAALICLTGGRTAQRTYERLADARHIPWTLVHVFWGDERHVAPGHADSNFAMAHRAFLGRVPVPPAHIHRIRAEIPEAHAAAVDYDGTLRSAFAAAGRSDLTFDLVLLGLGEDTHIASIFPGSSLLTGRHSPPHDRRHGGASPASSGSRVAAVRAPQSGTWRITLAPEALLDARAIVVLATGASKADAVHAALDQPDAVTTVPAQLLRAAGDRVEWFMDVAAAARRPAGPPS